MSRTDITAQIPKVPSIPIPKFIVSKGRADSRLTMRALDMMGVDYYVIVEKAEWQAYADAGIRESRLLVLPPEYQARYDTCDRLGGTKSTGPGPARNFAWDLAKAQGAPWHWVMDDNIRGFHRLNRNGKHVVTTPGIFHAMEDF